MDDAPLTCDVLIVGAGPAGLSVASRLPDEIRTIIVHQDHEIGLPIRTSGVCWVQDAERLGIPEDLYTRMEQIESFSDSKHTLLDLRDVVMVILDTPRLYRWLAQQSEHKDRQLLLATKFLTTRLREDGFYESTLRSRDRGQGTIVSRYIVDASGWHCAALDALGLVAKPVRLGVGTEYEYPLGTNLPGRAIAFVGEKVPAGYGWAFDTGHGTMRIGVGVLQPDTDKSSRALLDAVIADKAYLDRLGLRPEGEPVVHSGILPSVPYDKRLVFGNVIRVGDSANFATPTIGEGIRICIEQGRALGEALGKAARTGDPAPLRAYERACRRAFGHDYRLGFLLNQWAARLTPAQWNSAIRRLGLFEPELLANVLRGTFPPGRTVKLGLILLPPLIRSRLRRLWRRPRRS